MQQSLHTVDTSCQQTMFTDKAAVGHCFTCSLACCPLCLLRPCREGGRCMAECCWGACWGPCLAKEMRPVGSTGVTGRACCGSCVKSVTSSGMLNLTVLACRTQARSWGVGSIRWLTADTAEHSIALSDCACRVSLLHCCSLEVVCTAASCLAVGLQNYILPGCRGVQNCT